MTRSGSVKYSKILFEDPKSDSLTNRKTLDRAGDGTEFQMLVKTLNNTRAGPSVKEVKHHIHYNSK